MPPTVDDHGRARYVEELGIVFARSGWSRMAGRVLALLVLSNEPHMSTADIGAALRASPGSVSAATRELVERGDIREVAVPGSRSRHFRSEDDVCGSVLAATRRNLGRVAGIADEIAPALGSDEEGPRRRLENIRQGHMWVQGVHGQWECRTR